MGRREVASDLCTASSKEMLGIETYVIGGEVSPSRSNKSPSCWGSDGLGRKLGLGLERVAASSSVTMKVKVKP